MTDRTSLRPSARRLFALASLSALVACSGDEPTGGSDQLAVVATTPAAGATNVGVAAPITVTLSAPIAPTSVTLSTFKVGPFGGTLIGGSVAVSGSVATFTPNEPLLNATTYTARLTTAVADMQGRRLRSPTTWTFTTAPNAAPTVLSTVPATGATGVARTAPISVTFSEAIMPPSVTSTSFTVSPPVGGPIAGNIFVNDAVVSFIPNTALAPSTTYTVRLTSGITDLLGAPLAAYQFSFVSVANAPPVINAGPDQTVARGTMVQLFGQATDPEGQIMTFVWTQVGGVDVTGGTNVLNGSAPSFQAPNTATVLRFELRVTDQSGATSQPDTVEIIVQ